MSNTIDDLLKRQDEIDLERKDIKKKIVTRINEVRKIITDVTGRYAGCKNISWADLRDIGDNEVIHISLGNGPMNNSFPRKFLSMTDASIKAALKR